MTRQEAIRLAFNILRPFAESGLYDDYQAEEGFSDEQYEAMLAVLSEEDVVGGDEAYDAELAADQILERQELEDFEGLDPFEGAYDGGW